MVVVWVHDDSRIVVVVVEGLSSWWRQVGGEGFGHHEVGNYDGDDHGVVLVDRVDTLEVYIRESDRKETLW